MFLFKFEFEDEIIRKLQNIAEYWSLSLWLKWHYVRLFSLRIAFILDRGLSAKRPWLQIRTGCIMLLLMCLPSPNTTFTCNCSIASIEPIRRFSSMFECCFNVTLIYYHRMLVWPTWINEIQVEMKSKFEMKVTPPWRWSEIIQKNSMKCNKSIRIDILFEKDRGYNLSLCFYKDNFDKKHQSIFGPNFSSITETTWAKPLSQNLTAWCPCPATNFKHVLARARVKDVNMAQNTANVTFLFLLLFPFSVQTKSRPDVCYWPVKQCWSQKLWNRKAVRGKSSRSFQNWPTWDPCICYLLWNNC